VLENLSNFTLSCLFYKFAKLLYMQLRLCNSCNYWSTYNDLKIV